MKKLKKVILLLIWLVLSLGFSLEAKELELEKGEKYFNIGDKKSDYHLAWNVCYFELLEMETLPTNGNHLTYRETEKEIGTRYWANYPSFGFGGTGWEDPKMIKDAYYLMNVLLKEKYFWTYTFHQDGRASYENDGKTFYKLIGLLFKLEGDTRMKAIETLDEVKQMLGDIDTPSELLLWIYASTKTVDDVVSYKKIEEGYSVRYRYPHTNKYYFQFYNSKGKIVKSTKHAIVKKYEPKIDSPSSQLDEYQCGTAALLDAKE